MSTQKLRCALLAPLLLFVLLTSCGSEEPNPNESNSPELGNDTVATTSTSAEVLHISDIHFSPYHSRATFDSLNAAPFTEWEGIFERSNDTIFSTYDFDSNYPLFKSTLDKMVEKSPTPDFIMISGDFMAHNFEDSFATIMGITPAQAAANDYQGLHSFIEKTIRFLGAQIEKRYPNTPVFAALGNNDAYCGDYLIQPEGAFLAMFKDVFSPLMHHSSGINTIDQTWDKGGYYAAQAPNDSNLRIIVLNTILFSPTFNSPWTGMEVFCTLGDYGPSNVNPGDTMLAWLDDQLTDAAANGEKVWMMQHIPPGVNVFPCIPDDTSNCINPKGGLFLTDSFNTKYIDLVRKHADVIKLNIAGHYHKDDFRIIFDSTDTNPVSWLHILPSISPIYNNNPGFQVGTFDLATSVLTDYNCFYVDVQQPVSNSAAWYLEYSFSGTYNQPEMTTSTMMAAHQQLHVDTALQHDYAHYYPVSDTIGFSYYLKNMKYFLCGQAKMTMTEYKACVCNH